jgi:hypothetical protein
MTSLDKVYQAYLAKILDDEYGYWTEEEVLADMRDILNGALPRFKFPRVDLTIEKDHFIGDLSNEEIQILATFMKCEWVNRTIVNWENLKPLYEEKDFSHANLLDKLNNTLENEKKNAADLERIYYRSVNRKPFDFSKLAT